MGLTRIGRLDSVSSREVSTKASSWTDEELVFSTATGGRLDPGAVRRSPQSVPDSLGLPPLRVHMTFGTPLRATFSPRVSTQRLFRNYSGMARVR